MDELNNQWESGQEQTLNTGDFPYILFTVGENVYAVNSTHVLSIEILGDVTPMVESPHYLRGVTPFRGDFVQLVDMRRLFGMDTLVEEFVRRVDVPRCMDEHRQWAGLLGDAVEDEIPEGFVDDPHACTFGKWFSSYSTTDSQFQLYLAGIEGPHNELHRAAHTLRELKRQGAEADALREVADKAQADCQTVCEKLEGLADAYADVIREMMVVVEWEGVRKGLIVDAIVSVEYITHLLEVPRGRHDSHMLECLAKRDGGGTVLMLDLNHVG